MSADWAVFAIVASLRLLVPLAIPRYPLPAILAALLLDGVDQTLFQHFTALPLDHYQGYDKSLDIYYLTIAYISTLANWEDRFALRLGRLLFYWRLIGVALFEVTDLRGLLLLFPNTFEYFFIFYEGCRLRWHPRRIARRTLIAAAALIWICIKLPQEYWLHIAQLDATDWIKTQLLGASLDTPWPTIVARHPITTLLVAATVGLGVVALSRLIARRLPPAERTRRFRAGAGRALFDRERVRRAVDHEARQIVDEALGEKIVLISLVSISFAHVLPSVRATDLQLAIGLGLVVTINTALTHWMARRGAGWAFALRQFVVIGVVNVALVLAYTALRTYLGTPVNAITVLFFALLLTLLLTLFDRYRQVYLMRFTDVENHSSGANGL
ncbi:MAG: hypothetical protein JXA93_19180 [Anaerolineae bacterium]|nr:hypothetical protein [Anaerolineae bacterium]